jgi:hypothetical protein
MHFNDLLMRLRSQSLAGAAAVATLVGIFTKGAEANLKLDWLIAAAILTALAFFWLAIFLLDFFYYNRLLSGAVSALKALEPLTGPGKYPLGIDLSTKIDEEFQYSVWSREPARYAGVLWFYGIVFAVIIAGAAFAARMYCAS